MKKMFGKKKEMTPEQNREMMEESGLRVNYGFKREQKFGQFSDHAKELASRKREQYVPGSRSAPPANGNPYAAAASSNGSNPYAGAQLGYQSSMSSQPPPSYRTNASTPPPPPPPSNGGGGYQRQEQNPYASAQQSYSSRFGANQQQPPLSRTETMDTYDRNRNELFQGAKQEQKPNGLPGRSGMAAYGTAAAAAANQDEDELNQMPSELDQQYGEEQEQKYMDSEDEDVEAIKGQLRFTKQQSVNSTRNALRIASEAEESGRNTLGMLGSQGERLANTEHNLSLASTQNKIAEEKARELKQLNRSMFAVHVSNPFGAKRRLQEKEERIKQEKRHEQYEREQRRQTAFDSQKRVADGLHQKSELAQKYKNKSNTERSKYQFEADSEDEEMENEIDRNLDGISSATQRLKRLAMSTNEEVTRQNERLDNIAESTDNLDVNVHLNTSRLANIK